MSDDNGFFQIHELYCSACFVSVNSNEGNNAAIFDSGAWTASNAQQITVRLATEDTTNFSWRLKKKL